MKALHIPSKQTGKVIGYHHGRKAHLVRLKDGTEQYWTEDSVKLQGSNDMTSKILMKMTGSKGKTWKVIERVFDGVSEAAEYLSELTRLDNIKEYDKTGTVAELTNGWTIYSNYDIREIMKKKKPKKDLPDWHPFDLKKKINSSRIKSMGSKVYNEDGTVTQKPSKSSKTVKLNELTSDTRKARVVLRQLVRQKKITKPSRWEWEANSPELEIVKKALKV